MPGIKALRKIQLGIETTAGTAVAATTIWRGTGTIEDTRETVFVEEDVGLLPGTDRSYVPKLGASLSLESTPATFEQLPIICEMGIRTDAPAQDGAGSGYIYQYTEATTAAPTIKTRTIEGGDDEAVEEMEYAYVESLTIEGAASEACMMSAETRGRQVSVSAFTTTATLPTVEEILASKGKLYIDTAGGTIGSTQISNSLLNFALNWTTGLIAVPTLDGDLFFTFVKKTTPEITLDLTFEHDSSSVAEKVNWRAETPQLIRLQFEGSAVETAGTSYTYKTFNIDLAGKWDTFSALADQDGNDIVTGTFRARYNSTAAFFAELLIVNELTTLP